MQLDLFTPLKEGPLSAEQLADTFGVGFTKLEFLLYALVAATLLRMEGDLFSNTAEADHYLVRGQPEYIGHRHGSIATRYANVLKTAESIRTGTGQAMIDFSAISPARWSPSPGTGTRARWPREEIWWLGMTSHPAADCWMSAGVPAGLVSRWSRPVRTLKPRWLSYP